MRPDKGVKAPGGFFWRYGIREEAGKERETFDNMNVGLKREAENHAGTLQGSNQAFPCFGVPGGRKPVG